MSYFYNSILRIPERCVLGKKITKSFFLKNFEMSAADKKLLNIIQNMEWLASLKPSNCNIPELRNDQYLYEEVQVMVCTVPENQLNDFAEKCSMLFQKYIPYPLLVFVNDNNYFTINVCDKRINQNDKTKRTIESCRTTPALSKLYKDDVTKAFYDALSFASLDKTNLEMVYKSYMNAVVQMQAANLTGSFSKRSGSRTQTDLEQLEKIDILEKEILTLTNQIKKEYKLSEHVYLNVQLQEKRGEIALLKQTLTTDDTTY